MIARTFLTLLSFALLSLTAAAGLQAQVVLPASGYLAGPLDAAESRLGDEFFNFPEPLGMRPRPGESPLSGWIEFRFEPVPGDPDRAHFTFSYDNSGPVDSWTFENGQTWRLDDNRAFNNPEPGFANEGILNLRTGVIEAITVNPIFQNSTIAQVTRNNRIPFAFTPTYPFDLDAANALIGFLPPELVPVLVPPQLLAPEPGFLFSEATFTYGTDGQITGFRFYGWTAVPSPLVAVLHPQLLAIGASTLPPFAFGLNGELHFATPYACRPDTFFCPTPADAPNGIPLAPTAFFRPFFLLGSKDLAPAAAPAAAPPPCAPLRRSGSLLLELGGKLYQLGGRTTEGVTRRVDVYDLASQTWSPGPPLPLATNEAQGGVIGPRIYVYGGRAPGGGIRDRLQVFDALTGVWTEGPRGPHGVAAGAAAVTGGSLYVIGGQMPERADGLRYNDAVLIYHDGFPAGWDRMDVPPANAPTLTQGASAVAVGAAIYVMGGKKLDPVTGRHSVTDEVFLFNTISRGFEDGPALAWGVYDAAAGRAGNRIYLSGGRRQVNGPSTADTQVLVIGEEAWAKTRPMLFPAAQAGSATVDGEVYVAGGVTQDGKKASRVFQQLGAGRGWSVCGSQPVFTAADVVNSAALAVGPRPLSPGSLGVVTGYNLGADLEITVDGEPAAIVAGPVTVTAPVSFNRGVLPQRAWFRLPADLAGDSVAVELRSAGAALAATVPIAAVGPGIYVESLGETREPIYLDTASALACNQDGTLNYAANPAAPGDTVTLRMTGLGAGPSPMALAVTVDGVVATVQSVTPGFLPGLWDVTIVVPAVARSANRLTVEAEIGGVASNRAALAVLRQEDAGMLTRGRIPLPCHPPIPAGGP